jgi:hypothetical protein
MQNLSNGLKNLGCFQCHLFYSTGVISTAHGPKNLPYTFMAVILFYKNWQFCREKIWNFCSKGDRLIIGSKKFLWKKNLLTSNFPVTLVKAAIICLEIYCNFTNFGKEPWGKIPLIP